jgi:hypothetical protein
MRQAQQNRRGRGRNRKGQNPITRTYESNGPDVKIRGTPAHIAEKYVSMARDALSSGDPVLAENYLQHAEHYNRIIMSHREQQIGEDGRPNNNGGGRPRIGFDFDDEGDDLESQVNEKPVARGQEPQPSLAQGSNAEDDNRGGGDSQRTQGRSRDDDEQRPNGNAGGGNSNRGNGRRRPRYAENDDQPEFLKRPVRRRASNDEAGDSTPDGSVEADQAAE